MFYFDIQLLQVVNQFCCRSEVRSVLVLRFTTVRCSILLLQTFVTVGPGSGCMWSKHAPVNRSWMFLSKKEPTPAGAHGLNHTRGARADGNELR